MAGEARVEEHRSDAEPSANVSASAQMSVGRSAKCELVDVGPLSDFAEGLPVVKRVSGREVVVIKWRSECFAVRNICPHMAARLSAGWVAGELVGGDEFYYDIEALDGSPVVRCPWHGFRFRLRDGTCTVDAKLRVRSYSVIVRDGRVLVSP